MYVALRRFFVSLYSAHCIDLLNPQKPMKWRIEIRILRRMEALPPKLGISRITAICLNCCGNGIIYCYAETQVPILHSFYTLHTDAEATTRSGCNQLLYYDIINNLLKMILLKKKIPNGIFLCSRALTRRIINESMTRIALIRCN